MTADAVASALLEVASAVGGTKITGSAFFVGAKAIIGDGGLSKAWADVRAHDWSALIDVGVIEGAKAIAAIDPALSPIAPVLATLIVYARHHPAGTLSSAMKAADGHGGGDVGTDHVSL